MRKGTQLVHGVLALAILFAPFAAFADEEVPSEVTPPIEAASPVPAQILVKYDERHVDLDTQAGQDQADAIAESHGLSTDSYLESDNLAVVTASSTDGLDASLEALNADPHVEYAEPNYVRSIDNIATNDTNRASLWALENTGQNVNGTVGTAGDDINGPEAWALSTGSSTIVAVIDVGVNYTHPDLSARMWDGANCVSDTGSALGGCIHGYDFADGDTDPAPVATSTSPDHGTHVAGIIAASKDNGIGVIGIAPGATIMALRFGLDTASEVRAIDFARENGAKVINASYGGTDFSQAEHDAIQRFTAAGGIFVASSGNGGIDQIGDNDDSIPTYPASYDLPGIISVAASDQNDQLAAFSNFGTTTVDLAAPGTNIYSMVLGTAYDYKSGTSMASPYVAGTVALMEDYRPDLSASAIKAALLAHVQPVSAFASTTLSGGRLDAYAALTAITSTTTSDVSPPVITLNGANPMQLTVGDTFTDPGATVTDNVDATTTIMGTGGVYTTDAGTYTLTYNATDTAMNAATPVTRTVTVLAAAKSHHGGGGGGGGGGGSSSVSRTLFTPTTVPTGPLSYAQIIALIDSLTQQLLQLLALRAALGA